MATMTSSARVADRSAGTLSFWDFFRPLASLKLTVVLFAAAMVIVLVGTLAQDELNMYQVKEQYFSSWLTVIHFDVFVPQPFYPHAEPMFQIAKRPMGLPFPGGALIGALLLVNLIAAKMYRFTVSGHGGRLWGGVLMSAIGLGLIIAVIMAAQAGEGLQGRPPMSYAALWTLLRVACIAGGFGLVAWARTLARFPWLRWSLDACGAVLIGAGGALLLMDFKPSDPSLRILWQLIQGGLAGVPLLIGFVMIFGRRGANALVHFGIGLLMLGQFIFGDRQLEQKLTLVEGEVTNVLRNLDAVELAFVDRSNPELDRVVSIPASRLLESLSSKSPIEDPQLPVTVEVLEYFPNSGLGELKEGVENPATTGFGMQYLAQPRPPSGGAKSNTDFASGYVRLKNKESGEDLGVFLISQYLSDWKLLANSSNQQDDLEPLRIAETPWEFGLRFQRIPKPYWIKLDNVERTNYSGSETPRDYSSFIRLVDEGAGEDRQERIWMNNPLRYRGETFYQSDYSKLPDGAETTGIQVVANDGWMIPYVSCMLVLIGLCIHFSDTLVRFAGRQQRAAVPELRQYTRPMVIAAVIGAIVLAGMLAPRYSSPDGLDLYAAGKIPVSYGGRAMSLDSLASQTLQAASNKTSLKLSELEQRKLGKYSPGTKMSAMQWLLEIAAGNTLPEELPLFRIDAQEVLSELSIDRAEGHRYSVAQLRENSEHFNQLVEQANEQERSDPLKLSFKQRKLQELDLRVRAYTLLHAAFADQNLRIPTEEERQKDPEQAMRSLNQLLSFGEVAQSLERMNAPSVIPPQESAETDEQGRVIGNRPPWIPLNSARFAKVVSDFTKEGEAPATLGTFETIVDAYRQRDTAAFNTAVQKHLATVAANHPGDYSPTATAWERWLEAANPANNLAMLYILAAVATFVGFLVAGKTIRPAVLGMLCVLVLVHTAALIARMIVTGRPPVINLYSSAVFIGWSLVVAGIVFELLFRNGIGNLSASIAGGSTLLVAYGLDSGDTMGVLQAVLDTQFWLSTHVITVALGYSATFLAGLLGIVYLIVLAIDQWRPGDANRRQGLLFDVYRMTYGVVCFGILFSFIGTVLGGLWADDSWGRFWGWDPKENGALLIVLWNALLLHARWDRWVGPRGFAMLAVGGNIVTAWSWFGTNQLGIGLHSYGFVTGVLIALGLFALSQLIVIGLAFFLTKPPSGSSAQAA